MIAMLQDFGFADASLDVQLFMTENQIVQRGTPSNRTDILTSIFGADFNEAWARHERAEIDGLCYLPRTFTA